jgi:hypothetical protein
MNEKVYKCMGITGAGNIAIGIVVLMIGMVSGILSIICGVSLLRNKNKIIF